MNTLILVGGASASGKSTFVKELNNSIENSLAYRRVQAFFDYAQYRGIPKEDTFKSISSTDADNWFLKVCCNNEYIISDIHYALQMERNFKTDNSGTNIYQEYVPTISKKLIDKLLEKNIRVIAVHITCSSVVIYERAINRNKKGERELRAISLEDVELQANAERKEWLNVSSISGIESIELNSEIYSPTELSEQVINYIKDKKVLSLKKLI